MSFPHWGEENWTGPVKSALQWKWQVLWYCPWIGFRAWQRYGKVLPSSLPFWNNVAGIALRVNYLSGNHWTACWEAENPQPGQCPVPKLLPCLCCSLFRKSLALGQSSIPTPNVSLCLNKALEIHKASIWGLLGASHLSEHFILRASGLLLNILEKCSGNSREKIQNSSWS